MRVLDARVQAALERSVGDSRRRGAAPMLLHCGAMNGVHAFSIRGIPVAISPWFLVLLFLYGRGDLMGGLLWAVCITVSLLAHELGHALVAKTFGLSPRILLHGFGGLTQHQRAANATHEALIIASGPAAGLALGIVTVGVVFVVGAVDLRSAAVLTMVDALLYINFFWSAVNLLPLWPLDGGQLFRLGVLRVLSPRDAHRVTHGLSLLLLAVALYFLHDSMFGIVLVAMLGWSNVQAFQATAHMRAVRAERRTDESEMLARAREALAAGNAREAARLGHQLRADGQLTSDQLGEVWALLGRSTARLGDHEEAVRYLRRAPPDAETREALRECLAALGAEDELDALVEEQGMRKRGSAARRWLRVVLAFDLVTVGLAVGYWWVL